MIYAFLIPYYRFIYILYFVAILKNYLTPLLDPRMIININGFYSTFSNYIIETPSNKRLLNYVNKFIIFDNKIPTTDTSSTLKLIGILLR